MTAEKGIEVKYQYVDGAHFFTSDDEHAKGLCAASTDPAAAYLEVAHQLSVLVSESTGQPWAFQPPIPVDTFVEWLNGLKSPAFKTMAAAQWNPKEAA